MLLLVLVAGGFRCFFFGTGRSAPHREPENRRHPSPGGLRRTVRAALAKNGLLSPSLYGHYSVSLFHLKKKCCNFRLIYQFRFFLKKWLFIHWKHRSQWIHWNGFLKINKSFAFRAPEKNIAVTQTPHTATLLFARDSISRGDTGRDNTKESSGQIQNSCKWPGAGHTRPGRTLSAFDDFYYLFSRRPWVTQAKKLFMAAICLWWFPLVDDAIIFIGFDFWTRRPNNGDLMTRQCRPIGGPAPVTSLACNACVIDVVWLI